MNRRLMRFLLSGGSSALVEYSLFALLQMHFGRSWLLLSQSVSFAAGFLVSFFLNRSWVFRSSGTVHAELLKYGLIAGANLAAGNIMIALLVGPLQLNQFLSKFFVMGIIASWNYLLFSKIVFKPRIGKA